MATIWKFPIEVTDEISLEMPRGAEILSLHTQHGNPVVWALCDPDQPNETRKLAVFGTGHRVPPNDALKFIGTFLFRRETLVFHVFERLE